MQTQNPLFTSRSAAVPYVVSSMPMQSGLALLTPEEIRDLRHDIAERTIPQDLAMKLRVLAEGDLGQRHLAHSSVLLLDLLHATCAGDFEDISSSDFEHILRVLAYVRKENDAIPDFLPTGYVDDARELRYALNQLAPLLERYKAWRLAHLVPMAWTRLEPASR